jgi:hypothetical protein
MIKPVRCYAICDGDVPALAALRQTSKGDTIRRQLAEVRSEAVLSMLRGALP